MNRPTTTMMLLTAALTLPLFAQVEKRKDHQQDRIAQGIQSGELTPKEAARIERKQAALNHEIHQDRVANGGTLTPAEKVQVNAQQNALSKSIYHQKHDAQTAHYGNSAVGQRRENQQDRIAQGVANGSMTAGEAARAESKQAAINREIHQDRAANGGTLTPHEKVRVNRQLNQTSRGIYKAKH